MIPADFNEILSVAYMEGQRMEVNTLDILLIAVPRRRRAGSTRCCRLNQYGKSSWLILAIPKLSHSHQIPKKKIKA